MAVLKRPFTYSRCERNLFFVFVNMKGQIVSLKQVHSWKEKQSGKNNSK